MERIVTKPENREHWLSLRLRDVTSTEVSALFGLNPYFTKFELWHKKKAKVIDSEAAASERMKWGTRLQKALASGIIEDHFPGGTLSEMDNYISLPEFRAGSSFDYLLNYQGESMLFEAKNVDASEYNRKWTADEAPPHIEMQFQHEMLVSGVSKLVNGTLIGGNKSAVLMRERNDAICGAIVLKVREFWESIEKDIPPDPVFPDDASFLVKLYSYAEPGKDILPPPGLDDLVHAYQEKSAKIAELEKMRGVEKAKIIQLIGDAEKVRGADYKISAGMVGPAQVSYERKPYRNFKIFKTSMKEVVSE